MNNSAEAEMSLQHAQTHVGVGVTIGASVESSANLM